MNVLHELFGKPKAIIAMAHLPALPGQPLHDPARGMRGIVDTVRRDLEVLSASDIDGILFCNENDRPYRTRASAAQVAAMAAAVTELRTETDKPWGVDVLWDPVAAIAVAKATGGRFVREVFTGTYAGDFGLWNTDPAEALDVRHRIGGDDIRLFFNITAEFAAPVSPRPVGMVAKGAVFSSLADALCVSGPVTGQGVDIDLLREAKAAVGDTAVIANTGVRPDTVGQMLSVADGVIVGTYLKVEGITWNAVDPVRLDHLVEAASSTGLWEPGRPLRSRRAS
jgi:membrane complex biogenesis BtpA family protein